jgi:hypothetical protein
VREKETQRGRACEREKETQRGGFVSVGVLLLGFIRRSFPASGFSFAPCFSYVWIPELIIFSSIFIISFG